MKNSTRNILDDLIKRYPALSCCIAGIEKAVMICSESSKSGGKILACGNGGSAADALHIVGELMKAFVLQRKLGESDKDKIRKTSRDPEYLINNLQGALPAIALVSETSLTTAYSNDVAPDLAFAQQVFGYGNRGDVLIAISTSGNSKNVIYACEVAKAKDMKVISLTGKSGGKMNDISDVIINVPETDTFKVQELHLPVYHAICLALENEFFGEKE